MLAPMDQHQLLRNRNFAPNLILLRRLARTENSPGRTSDITEAVHWDAGVEVRVYSFREGVDTKIRPFGPHCWLVCGVVAPSDEPWTRDHAVRRRADTTHTPRS
jgi:hypothetical protein